MHVLQYIVVRTCSLSTTCTTHCTLLLLVTSQRLYLALAYKSPPPTDKLDVWGFRGVCVSKNKVMVTSSSTYWCSSSISDYNLQVQMYCWWFSPSPIRSIDIPSRFPMRLKGFIRFVKHRRKGESSYASGSITTTLNIALELSNYL